MITSPPRPLPGIKPTKKEHEVQQRQTFQPLTKRQIDERIAHVMSEVASADADSGAEGAQSALPGAPRWITPRALVERMKRFMVYN